LPGTTKKTSNSSQKRKTLPPIFSLPSASSQPAVAGSDSQEPDAWFQAVSKDDAVTVEKFLANGHDPNIRNAGG
jgi:hypothetical protein